MTATNVEKYIVRCQQRCPHDDQCVLEAGHENQAFNADIPAETLAQNGWKHEPIGCSHRGCFCNEPNKLKRPDWDQYFMAIARITSLRGSCDRLQVGAVLVADKRIIATGYNGAPSGLPTCIEVGHQLVDMNGRQSCVRTIHAEQNAIIQCSIVGTPVAGALMYTTARPCLECLKAIASAGVSGIVFAECYASARSGSTDLAQLAASVGISWRQLAK